MLASQLAFNYVPAMNWLSHSAPTYANEWLLAGAAGFIVYAVVGTEKFISSRRRRR